MEINKKVIFVITSLSIILLIVMDLINITKFIDYTSNIDSTISNIITFISILIGFVSTIYVMIQQAKDSYVLNLLRKNELLELFNNSFRSLMYTGFFTVISLIFMNFFARNITIFKIISYFSCPLTTYFLLSTNNFIVTICKMISAEEKLKKSDRKIEKEDLKYK